MRAEVRATDHSMRIDYQSSEALAPVIEALVFASDEPLSAQELRALILGEEAAKRTDVESSDADDTSNEPIAEASTEGDTPRAEPEEETTESIDAESTSAPKKTRKRKQPIELSTIHSSVELLNEQYLEQGRAFRIVEIAGGYQFATRSEYAEYVARIFKEKSRRRLSGAALETLAIVAYKQPVSKLDIEAVRGVNCDEVIKSLLEKNLITITGRAEAVGRPLLYGTTVDFLRHFGLPALSDLPKPRELEELMKEESIRATTLDEAASEFVTTPTDDQVTVDELLVTAHAGESVESDEDSESENAVGIDLDTETQSVEVTSKLQSGE